MPFTYAIADLHGRYDLLSEAVTKIVEHSKSDRPATIITLGDYVDRGPKSRQVIERLMNWRSPDLKLVCLKGNHEVVCQALLASQSSYNRRGYPRSAISTIPIIVPGRQHAPSTCFETWLSDGSAARSAHVRTMIWASRAALGAGGLNGTDRVGRYDLLSEAVTKIVEHSKSDRPATIITLGDYVDRGPKSR